MASYSSKAGASGGGKVDISGIPKGFIDMVMQNNPEGLAKAVQSWRERHEHIQQAALRASELKVGDKLNASMQYENDSANLVPEKHAFWTVQQNGGRNTKSRQALDSRELTITGIQKQKNGIKITAKYDTRQEVPKHMQKAGESYPVHTVTRIIPNDAYVRRYK